MSISLSCELLDNIGSNKAQFAEKCNEIKDNLLQLGKVFNSRIDRIDDFEKLIFDTDFQNRTVLKVITECELEPLMATDDPKAENIMNQVYVGKEATHCDGSIFGYSKFMHILTTIPKK